jgi:50S ribosome-binding GTPase
MDAAATRTLTSELADDLAWLEEHCRKQPQLAERAGELRLAAALVRNVVAPYLDGQPPRPLHLAVVGGAGTGKSTVVNFLCGATAAEANPQAGFTRHPIAYSNGDSANGWPGQLGFLGPLERLEDAASADVDEDVYQVRKLAPDSQDGEVLRHFVVWDCPDMTTWAASNYVPRLLEIAGLADVIVYVASDERYNDAVPTQFLKLLVEVGKPVVVVLTKMNEELAPKLVDHFRRDVLSRLPRGRVTTLTLPHLSQDELASPVTKAARHRIPLLNQMSVLGDDATVTRRRNVEAAMRFLSATGEHLLSVARDDVAALDAWRDLVHRGKEDFDTRYRREYLTSEKFRRFDEALVRLIDLLELPGAGKFVSGTLWVVRTPYRLLKGAMNKVLVRPEVPSMPESEVLEAGLQAWLDQLRAEALRRSGQHPLWAHVNRAFESDLPGQVHAKFDEALRTFRLGLADEVERTARAIYEELEKSPTWLATLRGSKLALDGAAIIGTIAAMLTTGQPAALDLVLVPLAASVAHQLVEWMGAAYVESQREQTRSRQQSLESEVVSGPLADWLARWPATGGTAYERLQLALSRVPHGIKKLDAAVHDRLSRTGA